VVIAYRPIIRPCACGADIVCIADEIPLGVAAHNATTPHQAWRAAGGFRDLPVLPTAFDDPVGPWDAYEHRREARAY
jgi:hypothetical protein